MVKTTENNPYSATITFQVTPERIRLLANNAAKRDLTSSQAEAFIGIYREDIETILGSALRVFVQELFPAKPGTVRFK